MYISLTNFKNMYKVSGRDPYASGGSTKRLYEVGRVAFNTLVDQTLLRQHARGMQSSNATADEKCVKRFKNTCGDTVPGEVSGSILPQEPLYVCMGHNGKSGSHAAYDTSGRPLNTVKACYVTSSLNHLQITYKDRLSKLGDYTTNANSYQENGNNWYDLIQSDPPLKTGETDNNTGNLFVPAISNKPEVRFPENLAIYRQLAPTFVGFASGSYDAPLLTESTKKPPHLAANCGGLMTVQASSTVTKREPPTTGSISCMKDDGSRGIEIGERLCVTYPHENWENKQPGVPKKKTTLVVCDAQRAQMEHQRSHRFVSKKKELVQEEQDLNDIIPMLSRVDGKQQLRNINARIEFLFDSYMTRPLEIGQCRHGCRTEGQMIDMKYDLVAPNIGDLLTYSFPIY